MTRQSLTRIAAGAAVAGLVALAASPAVALPRLSPTSTVPHPFPTSTTSSVPGGAPNAQAPAGAQAGALNFIQKAAEAAINARIATLNKVITDLGNVPPECSVGGLIGTANSDITQLQSLESTIEADTTVQQAKADALKVFSQFRVYALVVPVDEMVVATCRMSDVITKVNALVQKLQGVNDPNIAALVTDMGNNAQGAGTAINGLAAELEGYTPQMWNANHTLLLTARQALRTARKDLEQCRDDGHKILVILHHDYSLNGGNGANNVNPNAGPNSSTSTSSTTPSTTSTTAAG